MEKPRQIFRSLKELLSFTGPHNDKLAILKNSQAILAAITDENRQEFWLSLIDPAEREEISHQFKALIETAELQSMLDELSIKAQIIKNVEEVVQRINLRWKKIRKSNQPSLAIDEIKMKDIELTLFCFSLIYPQFEYHPSWSAMASLLYLVGRSPENTIKLLHFVLTKVFPKHFYDSKSSVDVRSVELIKFGVIVKNRYPELLSILVIQEQAFNHRHTFSYDYIGFEMFIDAFIHQHYCSLFAGFETYDLVLKIWDWLFVYGFNIVHAIATVMLEQLQKKFLQKFEDTFARLKDLPISPERVGIAILQIKFTFLKKQVTPKLLLKAFYRATEAEYQKTFFEELRLASEEAFEITKEAIDDRLSYIAAFRSLLVAQGLSTTIQGVSLVLKTIEAIPKDKLSYNDLVTHWNPPFTLTHLIVSKLLLIVDQEGDGEISKRDFKLLLILSCCNGIEERMTMLWHLFFPDKSKVPIKDCIFFLKEIEKALDQKNSWVRANTLQISLRMTAMKMGEQKRGSKRRTFLFSTYISCADIVSFLKTEVLTYTIPRSLNIIDSRREDKDLSLGIKTRFEKIQHGRDAAQTESDSDSEEETENSVKEKRMRKRLEILQLNGQIKTIPQKMTKHFEVFGKSMLTKVFGQGFFPSIRKQKRQNTQSSNYQGADIYNKLFSRGSKNTLSSPSETTKSLREENSSQGLNMSQEKQKPRIANVFGKMMEIRDDGTYAEINRTSPVQTIQTETKELETEPNKRLDDSEIRKSSLRSLENTPSDKKKRVGFLEEGKASAEPSSGSFVNPVNWGFLNMLKSAENPLSLLGEKGDKGDSTDAKVVRDEDPLKMPTFGAGTEASPFGQLISTGTFDPVLMAAYQERNLSTENQGAKGDCDLIQIEEEEEKFYINQSKTELNEENSKGHTLPRSSMYPEGNVQDGNLNTRINLHAEMKPLGSKEDELMDSFGSPQQRPSNNMTQSGQSNPASEQKSFWKEGIQNFKKKQKEEEEAKKQQNSFWKEGIQNFIKKQKEEEALKKQKESLGLEKAVEQQSNQLLPLNQSSQGINSNEPPSNIRTTTNKTENIPSFNKQLQESGKPNFNSPHLYYLDGNILHNASQEAIFPQSRFQNSSVTKLSANVRVLDNGSYTAGKSEQSAPMNKASTQEVRSSSQAVNLEASNNGLKASTISRQERQEANSNYLNTNRSQQERNINRSQPESNTSILDEFIFNLADRSIDNKILSTPKELSILESPKNQSVVKTGSNRPSISQQKVLNTPKTEGLPSQSLAKKPSIKTEERPPNFGFSKSKQYHVETTSTEPNKKDIVMTNVVPSNNTQYVVPSRHAENVVSSNHSQNVASSSNTKTENQNKQLPQEQQVLPDLDKLMRLSPNSAVTILIGGAKRSQPVRSVTPDVVRPTAKERDLSNQVQNVTSSSNTKTDNQIKQLPQEQSQVLPDLDKLMGLSPNSAVTILMGGAKRAQPVRSVTPNVVRPTAKESDLVIIPRNPKDRLELQSLASQHSATKTLYHLFDNRYRADQQSRPVDKQDTVFTQHANKEFNKLTSPLLRAYENHLNKDIVGQHNISTREDLPTFTNESNYSRSPRFAQPQRAKASGIIYFNTDALLTDESTFTFTQNETQATERKSRFGSLFESPESSMPSMQDLPSTKSRSIIDSRVVSETLLDFFKGGNSLNRSRQTTPRDAKVELTPEKKPLKQLNTPEVKDMGGFFNKSGVFLTGKFLEEDEDKDLFFYRRPVKKEFNPVNIEKPVYSMKSTLADGDEHSEPSLVINRAGRKAQITKPIQKNRVRVEPGTPEKYRYFEKDIEMDDYDYQIQKLREKGSKLKSQEVIPAKETSLKSMLDYFDKWKETKIF